jgi:hypothetical protein
MVTLAAPLARFFGTGLIKSECFHASPSTTAQRTTALLRPFLAHPIQRYGASLSAKARHGTHHGKPHGTFHEARFFSSRLATTLSGWKSPAFRCNKNRTRRVQEVHRNSEPHPPSNREAFLQRIGDCTARKVFADSFCFRMLRNVYILLRIACR